MNDPLRLLLADLERDYEERRHHDVVYGAAKKRFKLDPSEFVEIRLEADPRKTAFVDGGNGILESAPDCLISLNRVCHAIFRGEQKVRARDAGQAVTFLSLVMPHAIVGGDGSPDAGVPRWDTRVYAYGPGGRAGEDAAAGLFPDRSDLMSIRYGGGGAHTLNDSSPIASLARRLAEIRLAHRVVSDELDRGDILVMDGSLEASFDVERRYADDFYDAAVRKGVIVCGLAKTTRLLTESGYSLMARVSEISQDVPHGRWYVPVATGRFERSRSFVTAVRLHPNSRFPFRLDMLDEQFQGMTGDERNSVLGSLARNSCDIASLGYPYGAIEVDKHAKVRANELAMFRRALYSRRLQNPPWREHLRHSDSVIFHDLLNRVTG